MLNLRVEEVFCMLHQIYYHELKEILSNYQNQYLFVQNAGRIVRFPRTQSYWRNSLAKRLESKPQAIAKRNMLTQKQILEEIARCGPDNLKEKMADILKRKHHTARQEDAFMEAWNGLMWWRRTHVELMVKAYENS